MTSTATARPTLGIHVVRPFIERRRRVRGPPELGELGMCPWFAVNIAFLMDKAGRWSFDVTYNYHPGGIWTDRHQMTMNGKRDGFTLADFRACARAAMMKRGRAETIIEEVRAAVAKWPEYAEQAQVGKEWRKQIQRHLRLKLPCV